MDTVPLEAARLVLLLCGCFFCFWTASSSMAQDPRTEQQERSCVAVSFRDDSIVCACNGSYCDVVGVDPRPDHAHLLVYTSSQAGDRLLHRQIPLLPGPPTNSTKDVLFSFNPTTRYQRIKGFGGAVTDSAAMNIKSLSPSAQKNLLRAYFAPEGIEYNIIRVPIASCDFSTRAYTYDDVPGDLQLKHFSLAMEDVKYKIPVLHEITSMASRPLSLFASPWTAPPWMKTNDNFTGNATIKGRPGGAYYKSWANYFVKFLDEYENRNVSFWAVTVQNEPTNAPFVSFQSTGFTPDLERDFILTDLGPALQARRGRRVKIMAIDDQRLLLPLWPKVILSNPKAEQYVDGFALHWYLDDFVPAYLTLNTTHHLYPNIFLLATEACVGSFPGERAVQLGNWERGERYSHSIIQDFSYWVTGWTDWNLALDMKGGPNWAQNFVDSPIIVDSRKDTFYKQPMFYHLAHFSKFIPEGSQRVDLSSSSDSVLQVVAFMRGDDLAVIVILNRSSDPISFTLYDPKVGHARLTAASRSIQTLLWEHKNAWE